MTNLKLIERAVSIVVDFFEYEGIYENSSTIKTRVTEWYNRTDITDAEMLAAAAITGDYRSGVSYSEIEAARNFYFPTEPFNFSIEEIEQAQKDILWW